MQKRLHKIFFCCSTCLCLTLILWASGAFRETACAGQGAGGRDPVEMALLPGGKFLMGSEAPYPDEQPVHEVQIKPFYMDIHEVTNGQYKKYMDDKAIKNIPDFWLPEADLSDEPVTGVTWADAAAYAEWAGKRLPTEAEWEYAARGGSAGRKYPWGDEPDLDYANVNSFGILPVKKLKPNGYGLYDMIGNVWEWCSDLYGEAYYGTSPSEDPQGPAEGKTRVLRGWAWNSNKYSARLAKRHNSTPTIKSYTVGFRCVKSAHPGQK
ncbi:MAG: formylglycine-generating enzyme family protein [Pseudomonadota bacterium]